MFSTYLIYSIAKSNDFLCKEKPLPPMLISLLPFAVSLSVFNFNLYIPTFQLHKLKISSCTVQKNHLIFSKRFLLLSYSSTCTVQKSSCTDPILTCLYPKFKLFCWCYHHVLSNNFTRLCRIVILYYPNFDLYCPKIDLNFSKKSSTFRFTIEWSFP